MGIGMIESLILLAVVLIFGGWKALPNIAKSAGEFCSTFKKSYKDASKELEDEEAVIADIGDEADAGMK